jgi:2-amino-4-hydroxy-6-hydroxymethyldihydropteridine diphosphokinase
MAAPANIPVIIALGSNLGDRRSLLQRAREGVRQLPEASAETVRSSGLYATEPLDCPPGSPDFFNAAIALEIAPGTDPVALLRRLQGIEQKLDRPSERPVNSPRTIDLDLITFGGLRRDEPPLTLPHPRAHERAFVLYPLRDLEPELILPGQSQTVSQLVEEKKDHEEVSLISVTW